MNSARSSSRRDFDRAPTSSLTTSPFWKTPSVGMLRIPYFLVTSGFWSTFSLTMSSLSPCSAKIAYVDGVPAGYVLYAPPLYVPRSVAFPTSPVSGDAVLLMTASILDEFTGGGLGRMLVQGVAKDLTRRGVKAIEAFGDRRREDGSCVLPADYLLAVGFKTVRPHHHYPRLRLELKSTVSWREDVEVALERLLGSMTPERALRMA